jgi:hypothetical protein
MTDLYEDDIVNEATDWANIIEELAAVRLGVWS